MDLNREKIDMYRIPTKWSLIRYFYGVTIRADGRARLVTELPVERPPVYRGLPLITHLCQRRGEYDTRLKSGIT